MLFKSVTVHNLIESGPNPLRNKKGSSVMEHKHYASSVFMVQIGKGARRLHDNVKGETRMV